MTPLAQDRVGIHVPAHNGPGLAHPFWKTRDGTAPATVSTMASAAVSGEARGDRVPIGSGAKGDRRQLEGAMTTTHTRDHVDSNRLASIGPRNRPWDAASRTGMLLVALALGSLIAGCERAKTKLDREVDRLCAIDGGVSIYEMVRLSALDAALSSANSLTCRSAA